jgi:hypothetical protein
MTLIHEAMRYLRPQKSCSAKKGNIHADLQIE